MFVDVIDFHGQPAKLDPTTIIKLRPAFVAGDPAHCTLVDFVSGGLFAKGEIEDVRKLFSPHIRLAALHAPNEIPVFINADGIAAVLGPDPAYADARSIAIVTTAFENQHVPARNRIPLFETVAHAEATLAGAALD